MWRLLDLVHILVYKGLVSCSVTWTMYIRGDFFDWGPQELSEYKFLYYLALREILSHLKWGRVLGVIGGALVGKVTLYLGLVCCCVYLTVTTIEYNSCLAMILSTVIYCGEK
jgi:hypothetical protein